MKFLKDTVSALQADVLLLKQETHATERLLSDQVSYAKSTVYDLKSTILQTASGARLSSDSTLCAIENLTQSLIGRITEFEDRVRLLEAKDSMRVNPSEQTCVPSPDESDNEVGQDFSLPTEQRPADVYTAVPLSLCRDGATFSSERQGNPIPVLITARTETEASNDHDFVVQRPRRVKHFCVLGLSKRFSVDLLTREIETHGPSVSAIRVMSPRRNSSRVIVRLSIYADSQADRVMSVGLWPHYVTCKPWNSQWRSGHRSYHPEPTYDRLQRHPVEAHDRKTSMTPSNRQWELSPRLKRLYALSGNAYTETDSYGDIVLEKRFESLRRTWINALCGCIVSIIINCFNEVYVS